MSSRRRTWVCGFLLCLAAGLSSARLSAADREVGAGKTYATITAAHADAVDGDRIVVFSGTYTEQIVWTKAVDIVEASGETATLRPTDDLDGPFLVDIQLGSAVTVNWDGIDLLNDSAKFSRFFMERAGDPGAVVNIKNVSATDTPTAAGFGRVLTAETGSLNLTNVVVNMNSTAGENPGYEINVGAFGENVTIHATNCVFASPGGTVAHAENATATMIFENCILNRKPGPTGFLTDLGDGSYTFSDCYFTAADSTIRGILTRGGSSQTVIELNRCRFNPNVQWRAIQTEKATEMVCTNCCFPASANEGFFMLHNNAQLSAGDTSDFTFTHCTFAFSLVGNTSGIRDETVNGATVNYLVDNCIFYIPGSDAAHGAIHNNTQGGTVAVVGGSNYVFSDADPPSSGLLTGTIDPTVPEDPKLSTIDYCHIIDENSAVINLAPNAGITDDVDKEARVGNADYGADEFTGTAVPAPLAPTNVIAVPGQGSIKLGWNPPASGAVVIGYNVYRTAPAPTAKLNTDPLTGLDLVLTPLQNGTEYCFTVRSVGIFGAESPDSVQVCATPEGGGGVRDLEVGVGRQFETIQAAIDAARPDGQDRVLVFSGDYDEALVFTKQVDVVEAPDEEAVLHIVSPLPALSFVVEFVGLGNYTVNWDGIDVLYELTEGPRRMFLARFNNAGTIINFKNMTVRDTETSGGGDMRFFSNELAGVMNLENVTVDLVADTPDYQMVLSSHVGAAGITAKNCTFRGKFGGRMLYTEIGRQVKMTVDSCTIENIGRESGGTIGEFTDGNVQLSDCIFKGANATRGLFCHAGGRNQVLEVNRCTWDSAPNWLPIQLDKNLTAKFTNCCIASRPNGEPPNLYTILVTENPEIIGGDLSSVSLLHCTFSRTAEDPASAAVFYQGGDGNSMELTVQNCLFHLPGSAVGVVQKDPNAAGSIDVIAGKNLRFIAPSDSVTDDVLESDPAGVIVDGDPGLKADLCHVDVPSAAVNAGTNVGVNDDIDGEGRPPEAGVDLGADEFSGTPAPPCGISNLICNVDDGVDMTWSIDQDPPECRCARIEIRSGDTVVSTVAGNITATSIPCDALPGSGSLCVVCIGPDGTEKSLCCDFSCAASVQFHRGDADNNGQLQLTDAVRILGYLFLGQIAPTCFDAADADDNGVLQLTDAVRILGYLFLGQVPPAPPGPPEPGAQCGPDPTEDPGTPGGDLGCDSYTSC